MKLNVNISIFCIAIWLFTQSMYCQVSFDSEILEYKGIKLFQDSKDRKAYYYLPSAPRVVFKDSIYKIHLWKYIDVEDQVSGGIFNAQIEFSVTPKEREDVKNFLKEKNSSFYLKGQLPLFTFKNNQKYGNISFRVVTNIIDKNTNTVSEKLLTSGHAPIQIGSKATIMLELDKEEASLLEQLFRMGTNDLSVIITAYYPEKSPKFDARISIPASKTKDIIQKKYPNKLLTKEDVKNISNDLNYSNSLDVKIFDANDDSDKTDKVTKLVLGKLLSEMFTPSFNCVTKKVSRSKCYHFKDQNYTPSDSLYISIKQMGIRKVPMVASGNINVFSDSLVNVDDYISVIYLKNELGKRKELDFGINETYLEAFKNYINAVSIKVKTDTTHSYKELAFTWLDVKNGNYRKKLNIPYQNEGNYQYKVLWNIAKVDTTLSTDWITSNKPFVSLTPPLRKREVTINFDGTNKSSVQSILVDFAAILGKKKKATIIEKLRIKNIGDYYLKSFTMFTDPDSKLFSRTYKVIKGKGLTDKKTETVNERNILTIN